MFPNSTNCDDPQLGPALRIVSAAVNRLDDIRALGVGTLNLSQLPSGRLDALARQGYSVRAQATERMHEDRQLATWVARARDLEVRALDDVLDLFGVLVCRAPVEVSWTGASSTTANSQGSRSRGAAAV